MYHILVLDQLENLLCFTYMGFGCIFLWFFGYTDIPADGDILGAWKMCHFKRGVT